LYNPIFYTFITAHPKCIKIWDATTGALQSIFRDLTHKDITSICLDERKRKLFVGDSRGRMFSINIKNGAKMKKFKKGEKTKNKDKEDVSAMYYWGSDNNNFVLASSWDGNVRQYDDTDATEEGVKKYTMDKHKDSVTYLDFKTSESLCASCGDDGMIFIFNFNSYRQEGNLKLDSSDGQPLESIKICKFLIGTDILVSADLEGYIHFWCVTAVPHPKKNTLLCSIRDPSESDVGKVAHFPIRAMDYDKETQLLYTGDEMGYMNKWDVSKLIEKLEELKPKE
jgi:WD40 repeat protein